MLAILVYRASSISLGRQPFSSGSQGVNAGNSTRFHLKTEENRNAVENRRSNLATLTVQLKQKSALAKISLVKIGNEVYFLLLTNDLISSKIMLGANKHE